MVKLFARDRISVPYFFNPRLDAQFPLLTMPDERAAHSRGSTAGPSSERIFTIHGHNAWKSWRRAHLT